jgi:hypothetical protein
MSAFAAVQERAPEASTAPLLAGADFADAYRLIVAASDLNAAAAAERIFGKSPGWVSALLALRNRFAALIGLKTGHEAPESLRSSERRRRIGLFPVISETPGRAVMGFDDWHLDFRVIVDVAALGADRHEVTVTTLVRTRNAVGRIYLATIMPFHRLIARTLLAQAAKPLAGLPRRP